MENMRIQEIGDMMDDNSKELRSVFDQYSNVIVISSTTSLIGDQTLILVDAGETSQSRFG